MNMILEENQEIITSRQRRETNIKQNQLQSINRFKGIKILFMKRYHKDNEEISHILGEDICKILSKIGKT